MEAHPVLRLCIPSPQAKITHYGWLMKNVRNGLFATEFDLVHRCCGPGFLVTHQSHYTCIVKQATVMVLAGPCLRGPLSSRHDYRMCQYLRPVLSVTARSRCSTARADVITHVLLSSVAPGAEQPRYISHCRPLFPRSPTE